MVYKKAILDNGELFFPEKLSLEFLEQAKLHMGTRVFSNQYQNEVISSDDKPFKKEWIKYWDKLPEHYHTFSFIDPAISQEDDADYTAVLVVATDFNQDLYILAANRYRFVPRQIIDKLFEIFDVFNPNAMGIEDVAYQKALLYLAHEEMTIRNKWIPLTGIKPSTTKTKEQRILSLVPRFEWGRVYLRRGLFDLETEYLDYAGQRSKRDDLLDALASIQEILTYPTEPKKEIERVPSNHPDYEKWYIQQLSKRNRSEEEY